METLLQKAWQYYRNRLKSQKLLKKLDLKKIKLVMIKILNYSENHYKKIQVFKKLIYLAINYLKNQLLIYPI